jgi:anti-anti-sigma regulatory factor
MRRSRHGRHHVVTALVEEDGDARITLTGHLGGDAVDGLADELAAVLRNADRVTVDLDGLSTPDPAALGVLATALDRAGGWPAAKLGLVAHDPHTCQALQTTGIARLVAVATDQDAARACSDHRPADARADWHLPAALASPHQARQLVEMRLYSWGFPPDARRSIVRIASELVSTAVEHALTPMRLGLAIDETALRTTVRDYSAFPPVLVPGAVTGCSWWTASPTAGDTPRIRTARPPGPVSAIRDDRRAAATHPAYDVRPGLRPGLARPGPPPGPYPSHA